MTRNYHHDFLGVMEYLGDELRTKQALFTKADASGARSVSAFTTQTNSGGNHGKGGPKPWHNAKKDGKKGGKSDGKSDEKVSCQSWQVEGQEGQGCH